MSLPISKSRNTFLTGLILFYIIIFSSFVINAKGQELSEKLFNYNKERLDIQKTGMLVLSGWALANLAVGGYGNFSTGERTKYFHQMNATWNLVNLSIGAFAYYQSVHVDPTSFSFAESISEARTIENILLFNLGLDVGYLAAGAYLWERGIRKDSNRLLGYGSALILQGGFLLIFDAILYRIHRSNNKQLFELLEHISLTNSSFTITVPL